MLWYAQADWRVLIPPRGRLPVIIPLWLLSSTSEMQLSSNLHNIPHSKQEPCHFEVLVISENRRGACISSNTLHLFVSLFLLLGLHGHYHVVASSDSVPAVSVSMKVCGRKVTYLKYAATGTSHSKFPEVFASQQRQSLSFVLMRMSSW